METKFDWIDKLNSVQVESKRLNTRHLKNFIDSTLLLNNISYSTNSKIFLLYLNEIKNYQVLVFDDDFDNAYLECFLLSDSLKDNKSVLFIYKKYIVLYINKEPYFFQKNSAKINNIELKRYLENSLKVNIEYIEEVDDKKFNEYYTRFKKENKKKLLKNYNKTKEYFLVIYSIYICLIIAISFLSVINEKDELKSTTKKINILKDISFKPFVLEYSDFIKSLNKNKLVLNSFFYEKNITKFIFQSKNKSDIYNFLLMNKNKIFNSSIMYSKELKTFICEVEIKR